MQPQSSSFTNYTLLNPQSPHKILAVEDEILSMSFMEAQIKDLGNEIIKAENGKIALDYLQANPNDIDVILMDREMPIMDGLTAVQKIKSNPIFKHIPIIMVTGADSNDEMKQGLDAGVFYYLTKPVASPMLKSVLSAAIRESQQSKILAEELGKHKASFNLIETCKFKFQTLSEAESLAAFIANCFPDPYRVLPGLGALLINAVEHGILQIGYDKKTELIEAGIWRAEIEQMLRLPNYKNVFATATIAKKNGGTYVIIEDPGNGFQWQKYMRIDPSRAGDNHGRGIAQANTISFDKLTYNQNGTQAIAFVDSTRQLEW